MRKRVFVFGVAVTAVALAFALTDFLLITLGAGVTEANVRRIRLGMTKPQVERILGGPGRYEYDLPEAPSGAVVGCWHNDRPHVEVIVYFDVDGTVVGAECHIRREYMLHLSSKGVWYAVGGPE